MFTMQFLRNSLLSSVNSSRIAGTRSLQLFRKPKGEERKVDDDDEDEFKELEKFSLEEMNTEPNDPVAEQRSINRMRNKSRLRKGHKRMLYDKLPYDYAESWIHNTLKYKRSMYGRYGNASQIDPRICFPTATELEEKQEYEKVAHPWTLQEMMISNEETKRAKAERTANRELTIAANIVKLGKWTEDLINKKGKKEEEARVAKERKDRLIEEVRRHFGYTVHSKDERFVELLEKKEKEERKKMKEAKKQVKEAKMLAKIAGSDKLANDAAKAEKYERKKEED